MFWGYFALLGSKKRIIRIEPWRVLVVGGHERDVIPNSIKLLAGRTGQEFNQRKSRKGAFWEDRYHATAVESGNHLSKYLVYSDLHPVK